MKQRLFFTFALSLVASCGSGPAAETTGATESSFIVGDALPSVCEWDPDDPSLAVTRRGAYAIGLNLPAGCPGLTLAGEPWGGAPTFPGVPGMCSYQYNGKGDADFDQLRGYLAGKGHFLRAACGGKRLPSIAEVVSSKPGNGITCGACTPAGMLYGGQIYMVRPPRTVAATVSNVTLRFFSLATPEARLFSLTVPPAAQVTLAPLEQAPPSVAMPLFFDRDVDEKPDLIDLHPIRPPIERTSAARPMGSAD